MGTVFDILIVLAIAAVAVTLGFGIRSLYRTGPEARSRSNKLMRLRVALQAFQNKAASTRADLELHGAGGAQEITRENSLSFRHAGRVGVRVGLFLARHRKGLAGERRGEAEGTRHLHP